MASPSAMLNASVSILESNLATAPNTFRFEPFRAADQGECGLLMEIFVKILT